METVIKNLCENSIKYGASMVKVNTNSSAQHLEIEISDNGQGMESKSLPTFLKSSTEYSLITSTIVKGLGLDFIL
jgi:two-component system phosphate regulon sensor histidine kinase PhoR